MPKINKEEEKVVIEEVVVKEKGDITTLAKLKEEEKTPIMLPITDNMEPQLVVINGCIFAVPRGKIVSVPKSVAEVIQVAQLKQLEAKDKIKITSANA